jgi:hypothetical protein
MTAMSSDMSTSQQIDAIIKEPGGWRSTVLSQLRGSIKSAGALEMLIGQAVRLNTSKVRAT